VAPANITLSALAGDNDGSVTNVEFFNGATFLGNDISSPYAFPWNGVAAGRYTLTVKATDNRGAATTSAAITVEVVDNLAPTVSITNPPNNTVLTAPASFALTASADDNDGNMVNVEFYNGASSLGIDSSDPYSVPITNLAAGTYLLSAVATDDGGAKATNTITLIVNALPTASITGPTNGQSFVAPANITLTALAGDSDGTVTNVQFFNGATLLGNDTSIPYAFAWNGVEAGSYSLTVKATDNRGASTTSASITISVTNSVPNAVMLLTPTWDGATFIFSFATQAGRQYEVHFIDVLGGSDWHLLTDLTGTGETFTVTNFSPSAAQRIYRIESK
jgi:hypothetical protein